MQAIHFITIERKKSLQRTENKSGRRSGIFRAGVRRKFADFKKYGVAIEKKKPGRQEGGASEPGQEGESPEWTIPI